MKTEQEIRERLAQCKRKAQEYGNTPVGEQYQALRDELEWVLGEAGL